MSWNRSFSRDSEVDSEEGEGNESDLLRSRMTGSGVKQARELFGIDDLQQKPIPKLKKGSILNSNSRQARCLKAKVSFDGDNDNDVFSDSGDESVGEGKLRPVARKRQGFRPKERRQSHTWAEQASRMRRSIRLKRGLHFTDLQEEEKDGKVIVRSSFRKEKKVRENKLWKKELKNNLKGVAALLTGGHLMNAKLMGAKSYWKLSQLIFTSDLKISKYFIIRTAKEIIEALYKMHLKLMDHGLLSSDTVLLDRSLRVGLMKPQLVRVKGKFNMKRLQNDIFRLGIVLVELVCRKPISSTFCPNAFRAESLEFTLAHGERNVSMYHSYRTFRTKKNSKFSKNETFADLEPLIRKEVLDALNDVRELQNLDTVKKTILDCFSANLDERPFSLDMLNILKQTEEGYTTSKGINVEADSLSMLKNIMGHSRLGSAYIKGPRLVEFTQEKTAEQQRKHIENIKRSTRKTKKVDSHNDTDGFITDDSHFVEDQNSEAGDSVETDLDEKASDMDTKAAQPSIKLAPKAPKKKGLNILSAYFRTTSSSMNSEDSSSRSVKSRKPNSSSKKVNLLSQFSQMNDDPDDEDEESDEYMSLQESQIMTQKSIHTQVKNNYGIDKRDLADFKAGFARHAKKRAKKKRQRFDPKKLAEQFQLQKRLTLENVEEILSQAESIMSKEPNLLRLKAPMTVVGDIHGQFFDLNKMMEECGQPATEIGKTNGEIERQSYLFLGDYVDRGNFSCEVLFYLLACKIRYPANVWLLRGNHECKATSGFFGFKDECEKKYNTKVFSRCCDVFQTMPVAALVETPGGTFFCLHGGISHNVRDLNQFVELDRFTEPQMYGFLCDVLWADPLTTEDDGMDDDSDDDEEEDDAEKRKKRLDRVLGKFFSNPLRGCSFRFGLGALMEFLLRNDLVGIIRAHQVQQEGFTFHFQDLAFDHFQDEITALSPTNNLPTDPTEVCPPIVTVFSAPNYCGRYGNRGAYLNIFQKPNGVAEDVDLKTARYSPLSLLDPVQFDAAYEPEVVHLPSETAKHSESLKQTCPYMPMGYEDLFDKAISLQKVDFVQELANNAQEVYKNKSINHSPSKRKRNISGTKLDSEVSSETGKNLNEGGVYSSAQTDSESVSTWQSFRTRMNNYEIAAKKKYNQAKRDDMINEIHPQLMQQKKEKAQEMVANTKQSDFNLPSQILLEDKTDDRRRTASMNLSKLQREKSVKFDRNELIALQTLYLIIDSEQTGKIDAKALIEWTENGGGFLDEDDAEHTVKILDFDKDGFIGFEDFLIFAAACKKMYLAELYVDIITQGL